MKRTLSLTLSTGVSALAVAAALSFSATTAQAVPCTVGPAEPHPFAPTPLTAASDILCQNNPNDPLTVNTGGHRRILVDTGPMTGNLLVDAQGIIDATGAGLNAIFVNNVAIQGDLINNGLVINDDNGSSAIYLFGATVQRVINNGFIYRNGSDGFTGGIRLENTTSSTGILQNGTISSQDSGIVVDSGSVITAGGILLSALSTTTTGGDIVRIDNSNVTGNVDIDGVGTAGDDGVNIRNGSTLTGSVIVRGTFTANDDGINIDNSLVTGGIDIFGNLTALNGDGIEFENAGATVNGPIRILAGAVLTADDDGLDIDGYLGPVAGPGNIQIFGTLIGGNGEAIDLTGATNALGTLTEGFDGSFVTGQPAGAPAFLSQFVFNGTAYDSRNGFSDVINVFGGTWSGGIFGNSSTFLLEIPNDVLNVVANNGVAATVNQLRDANPNDTWFWKGGDNTNGNNDIILNAINVQSGIAVFGDTAVDPFRQLPVGANLLLPNGNGPRHRILVADFAVTGNPTPALAFFDASVLTKVTDNTTFTLAAGSTLVLETGITDTIAANRAAGGAIAALPVPTPNDKCDYFAVACPYYNAAGFNVDIARFLVQAGQINNSNLVLATDSVRFIQQARPAFQGGAGRSFFDYQDVIQDLNNVGDFLNGRFASVTTTAPVFIRATERYRTLGEVNVAAPTAYDNIDIELNVLTFEQAAPTFNTRSVGWAHDNFASCYANPIPGSVTVPVLGPLSANLCPPGLSGGGFISGVSLTQEWANILESVTQLTSAADYLAYARAISGDEYAQTSQIGLNLLDSWTQGVNNRLRNALYSQNGVQWADNGGVQVASLGGVGVSGLGASGTALGAAKGGSEGWASWGRGVGQWASEDGDAEATGYDTDTLGFQGGVDWTSSSGTFLMGGSVMWSQTDVEFEPNTFERAEIDSLQGGLYASYGFGQWYWNAQASIGRNDVELNRTINFSFAQTLTQTNFAQTAQLAAGYTQTGWTFGTEIGSVWNGGDWNIQPYLGLKYRDLSVEDIVERSLGNGTTAIPGGNPLTPTASPFQLTVVDGDAESLQSELGARFTTNWDFSGTMIRPEIEVSWLHEFLDTRQSVLAHYNNALVVGAGTPILNLFATSSPNFQIVSSDIGEDAGQIKLGFNAVLDDNWELYAGYRGLFTDGYQDHGATITVKANW